MKLRVLAAIIVSTFPLIVLADIAATSTDSAATSTSNVASTTTLSTIITAIDNTLGVASTTAATSTQSSNLSGASASATSSSSASASTSTISTISSGTATAQPIATAEESYFKRTGAYFQVLPNNTVPSYESGTVVEALGTNIPSSARIDIYTNPNGEQGYQITYQESGTQYSVGEGAEANDRSYSVRPEISTTTPPTTAPTNNKVSTSTSTDNTATSSSSSASTTVSNTAAASSSDATSTGQ